MSALTKGGNPLDSHTLYGHARAIRALLNWAVREELLGEHVVKRLTMPKREYKVIPTLSQRHIDLLFAACDHGEIPEYVARDRAMLALLLDTGMRASELCGLTLDRVIFNPDEAYCLVHGKRRKQREVGLGRLARQALHRYIHRYRLAARTAPHVFVAKGGTPLTAEGLDRLLYRLRDRAGLGAVRVSAHVWRHTYALRYLEQGGDIYRLSRLMGHSSVATTEGYLRTFNSRQARLQGKAYSTV